MGANKPIEDIEATLLAATNGLGWTRLVGPRDNGGEASEVS
jgi:hypothetical protein